MPPLILTGITSGGRPVVVQFDKLQSGFAAKAKLGDGVYGKSQAVNTGRLVDALRLNELFEEDI